jgi:hypothetical protein
MQSAPGGESVPPSRMRSNSPLANRLAAALYCWRREAHKGSPFWDKPDIARVVVAEREQEGA